MLYSLRLKNSHPDHYNSERPCLNNSLVQKPMPPVVKSLPLNTQATTK